jgi:acylphosphatase
VSADIHHWNITVQGRVQGVGYRANARERAQRLGLRGFVKNQADGSVYLEVEGSLRDLEEMLTWCRRGPVFARVEHLDLVPGPCCNYSSFRITY